MLAGVAGAVRYAASFGRLRASASRPVWGDGFANAALSTLWYSRSWSDVSDDELALFLPCLTDRDDADFGVAARVRAGYVRRIRASRLLLRKNASVPASCAATLPDIGFAEEMQKLPTLQERAIADRLGLDGDRPHWASEAAILHAIEYMYRCARGEDERAPSLDSALLASIHAAINAAYVYPDCEFAHELLATGAWLGILLMGRRVMMPPYVAEVLLRHLGERSQDETSEVLQFHAALLGGRAYFLRHARNVVASATAKPIESGPSQF